MGSDGRLAGRSGSGWRVGSRGWLLRGESSPVIGSPKHEPRLSPQLRIDDQSEVQQHRSARGMPVDQFDRPQGSLSAA